MRAPSDVRSYAARFLKSNENMQNHELMKHAQEALQEVPEEHRRRGVSASVGAAICAVVGSVLGGPICAAVGASIGGAVGIAVGEKSGKGGAR